MFLDYTQRRTTVGRTPLDEWSARRRDLYLTRDDTHNRKISMPPVGFDPTISAADHSSRGVLPTVLRRCVWSRNIKNRCSMYIYDISSLSVNDLTLFLLTWRKWTPDNASKWQMGFNSAFKGLIDALTGAFHRLPHSLQTNPMKCRIITYLCRLTQEEPG